MVCGLTLDEAMGWRRGLKLETQRKMEGNIDGVEGRLEVWKKIKKKREIKKIV